MQASRNQFNYLSCYRLIFQRILNRRAVFVIHCVRLSSWPHSLFSFFSPSLLALSLFVYLLLLVFLHVSLFYFILLFLLRENFKTFLLKTLLIESIFKIFQDWQSSEKNVNQGYIFFIYCLFKNKDKCAEMLIDLFIKTINN